MPANDYTDWEPVNVIDNDIALLPVEGPVAAFQYRKTLALEVPAFLFEGGLSFKGLTWEWAFRVRENIDGESKIIFQSETRWTARIVVLNFGVEFISWQPLGDAGGGETTTTIINGEPIDPAEAWKYVDENNPTQNDGQGYTIFNPEGAASFGTYYFFADWVSPKWLQNLEPGNALDANDSTTLGNISDEATYEVSLKAGQPIVAAAFDNFGAMLQAYTYGSAAGSAQGYESYVHLGARATIAQGSVFAIGEDRFGRVWQLVRRAEGWMEYVSYDGNRTTALHSPFPIWSKEIRFADMILDPDDGSRLSVATEGRSVTFKRVSDGGEIVTPVGVLPKTEAVTLQMRDGKLFVVGESGVVFVSLDRGANWKPRGTTAEEVAAENGVIHVSNA